MVGMEHCSCQMSFFQGCIDEVRPWVKVIGICVNVNRVYVVFCGIVWSIAITKNVKEMKSFQGSID